MKYFVFFVIMFLFACKTARPLATVPEVELKKYAGIWYEIAAFPLRAEKHCACTTAEYIPNPKGYVVVKNRCQNEESGEIKKIKGKAFPVKNTHNSQLKVQFFPPFKSPYYIIALDSISYQYAAVGTPNRKYLWILCRDAVMDSLVYQEVRDKVKHLGFDLTKLKETPQGCYKNR